MGVAPRPSSAVRLLLVDADPLARRTLRQALESRIARPLMIIEAGEAETARAVLVEHAFDAVVLDIGTVGGIAAFSTLAERGPAAAVFAAGPASNVRDAVAAVRAGAADFIEKPLDGAAFARRIERLFVVAAAPEVTGFEGLVGRSEPMRALQAQIERIAAAPAPVFIFGESGTGKGLVARAVHARSHRRAGAFAAVACVGQTADALLADLIAPGGAIDRADGGTLFLDEVFDLPDAVQAVLLRLIETGEVGAVADRRRVSPRIVAASNRSLADLSGGRFLRKDLFFRLNVLTLTVPPLRACPEDVPALAADLLRQIARRLGLRPPRLAPEAEQRLVAADWPGNARELGNLLEQAILRERNSIIDADAVAGLLAARDPAADPRRAGADPVIRPLWMEEARLIEEAIEAFAGNIAKAAAALEISPSTIYRKRRGPAYDAEGEALSA